MYLDVAAPETRKIEGFINFENEGDYPQSLSTICDGFIYVVVLVANEKHSLPNMAW